MREKLAEIDEQLMDDPVNRIVFREAGGVECYLVGGFIRDVLLQKSGADRDYVVRGDAGQIARLVGSTMGGKRFCLGHYGLERVVLPGGGTLDFSPLRSDLKEDLMERDFGCNGMAWAPGRGLIDEVGGLEDIERRRIRAIGPGSISSDPLRAVRAFRFSQELGFDIESDTLKMISEHGSLLKDVAGERITSEIIRIINASDPDDTLNGMIDCGVLSRLIFLNNEELRQRIKVLSTFRQMVNVLPVKYHFMLWDEISQGIRGIGMIRLAVLLAGGVGHKFQLASVILRRLNSFESASRIYYSGISMETLFELLEGAADAARQFLVLVGRADLMGEVDRYQRICRTPLLRGDDLGAVAGLSAGPMMGSVLRELRRLEFLGRLRNREEAVEAAVKAHLNGI